MPIWKLRKWCGYFETCIFRVWGDSKKRYSARFGKVSAPLPTHKFPKMRHLFWNLYFQDVNLTAPAAAPTAAAAITVEAAAAVPAAVAAPAALAAAALAAAAAAAAAPAAAESWSTVDQHVEFQGQMLINNWSTCWIVSRWTRHIQHVDQQLINKLNLNQAVDQQLINMLIVKAKCWSIVDQYVEYCQKAHKINLLINNWSTCWICPKINMLINSWSRSWIMSPELINCYSTCWSSWANVDQ